jgi:hypothetical protein
VFFLGKGELPAPEVCSLSIAEHRRRHMDSYQAGPPGDAWRCDKTTEIKPEIARVHQHGLLIVGFHVCEIWLLAASKYTTYIYIDQILVSFVRFTEE